MGYARIEINPTISTDAYAAKDVLFALTSFELPSKSCKIISAWAYEKGSAASDNDIINLYFFRKNTTELGSVSGSANITADLFQANQPLGVFGLAHETDRIDDEINNIHYYHHIATTLTGSARSVANLSIALQGDTGTGVGNTCYVSGIQKVGTPTYAATDDLVIVLSVEY